ncbi:aminotransferase class I/II-fold pyridoxal phosphate-dependent enzyme [Paenarthrobacter sp. NPDC090517]|uniref:aminotransferase class I/II-fold pyridoxal phosphate-dependent enzyme n=1 Tax=Paenarthrobacter sp. NPDC090517 TaxID=3364381 RepID=UPI0038174C76
MNQSLTPYADALNAFSERDLVRIIVPGHGAEGGGVPEKLQHFIESKPFHKDFTPLLTGLDKGAGNPLDQAKMLAAQAWNARRVWFLTNGASQGNRITALALRGLGEHLLAQRSTHSSFVDGLVLSGLTPEFVLPSLDLQRGIAHGVSAAAVDQRLAELSERPVAVYVISPSYFGAVANIEQIAEVVHRHGLPLIVDAAWGAHFGFSRSVPDNPINLGADLAISSTHKLGGSLTQSAMLHLAEGPYADQLEPLIDRAFGLTQSTSENTWLLASLDIARHFLANGEKRIDASVEAAESLRRLVRETDYLELVEESFKAFPDILTHDPLHVAIDVSGTGISGHELKEYVANEHGVYFEASTHNSVVALIGAGAMPDAARIVQSIEHARVVLGRETAPTANLAELGIPIPAAGRRLMSPRDAFMKKHEIVPASEVAGRISADTLAAYPPGIPNLLPGEEITEETVKFLSAVAASPGGFIRGAVNRNSTLYRVVSD